MGRKARTAPVCRRPSKDFEDQILAGRAPASRGRIGLSPLSHRDAGRLRPL